MQLWQLNLERARSTKRGREIFARLVCGAGLCLLMFCCAVGLGVVIHVGRWQIDFGALRRVFGL